MRSYRGWAAAGIVGPLTFVVVSLVGGWIQPGYSAFSDYVSALSLGKHGWVQVSSFMILGASLLLFAATLAREFTDRGIPLGGPIVLAILGVGYLLSGPLVMDRPGASPGAMSWHGIAHGILGALVFVLMPVATIIFLPHLRRRAEWRGFWWPTLVLGCLIAIADVAFTAVTKIPRFATISATEGGLLQRLVIVPFMCWVALFAGRVLLGPRHD